MLGSKDRNKTVDMFENPSLRDKSKDIGERKSDAKEGKLLE